MDDTAALAGFVVMAEAYQALLKTGEKDVDGGSVFGEKTIRRSVQLPDNRLASTVYIVGTLTLLE